MNDSDYIQRWYLDCVAELKKEFPKVEFDQRTYGALMIYDFPLPATMNPRKSDFLIKTPGKNISNVDGYKFYLDRGVRLTYSPGNNHLYYDGYNDMQRHSLARISFHLKSFRPTLPINQGDTLVDICISFHAFLGERW